MNVYFSNQVEQLYDYFKSNLFVPGTSPFARRLVIVSSPAIKSWLILQLAKDPSVGIAAGIEVSYLEQTLQKLLTLQSTATKAKLPHAVELALAIEWEVKLVLQNEESALWKPLFSYLHAEPGKPQTKKSERRLLALSETLASLFLEYGKYGGKSIAEWEKAPQDWQQALWNRIFGKQSFWTYPYRLLHSNDWSGSSSLTLHLFSLSFLPKLHYSFFSSLSASLSIHHYLLSPCQLFWSDMKSEREAVQLVRSWKKRGASLSQQDDLEAYLKDCNPLLANFGKLGKEMALQIEESLAITHESYLLPDSVSEIETYSSSLPPETKLMPSKQPLSLLQAIQADMLLLRNPSETPKIQFETFDRSIQLHACPTRLREVQAVYDILLNLIDRQADSEDPIHPQDILVMAPAITDYAPFIDMVFVQSNSLLDAQVMDLQMASENILVQGFLHLLSLPFGRWDAVSLHQLFRYPAFRKKHRLTQEDFQLIENWIKVSGVNWGHDSRHRDELLKRGHCPQGMLDKSAAGTWEFGIERLLAGLILHDFPEAHLLTAPCEGIDFSQGELLGKMIQLLRSLRHDLRPLADGTFLSLSEWSVYLQTILEKYFETNSDENEAEDLFNQIEAFRETHLFLPKASYSFSSIKKQLEGLLSKQTVSFQESHLSAVKFCSLVPLRTIPAKVIILMGMHEGAFPRQDQKLSLNLLLENPQADYAPSQTDFDRYLFLEALLSARNYFVMSYLNCSENDSKEQSPSLLVTELMNYLDNGYEISGGILSSLCLYQHAYHAFDKSYFVSEAPYPGYSKENYDKACAFYQVKKRKSHPFIPQFILADPKVILEDLRIDFNELTSFAKNPLKTYFNYTLGMYLKEERGNWLVGDEKFDLSHLERDSIKKISLKNPLESVLENREKRGEMPLGIFKELAIDRLVKEREELKGQIRKGGADPDTLFDVEFSELYTSPKRTEKGHWQLPPLQIHYKNDRWITLVGKLNDVSNEGLVVYHRANKVDLVKLLPHVLVFQSLLKTHALPIQPHFIFAKEGKKYEAFTENPSSLLENYVEYYLSGKENPFPLIPEWVPHFLTLDKDNIREALIQAVKGTYSHHLFYNDYMKWLLREGTLPAIENSIDHWRGVAEALFGAIFRAWGERSK